LLHDHRLGCASRLFLDRANCEISKQCFAAVFWKVSRQQLPGIVILHIEIMMRSDMPDHKLTVTRV